MGYPGEPNTNEPIPTAGADDSDMLLSGETATTGRDEASLAEEPGSPAGDELDSVNLSTPTAAAYWARHFQATREQMQEAVDAVGHDPRAVAEYLGKPWPYEKSGIV